jgi:excinuclease ABC subunit C
VSSREVRDTIKLLRKIFPLRACSNAVFNNRVRPCLDYQLGICSAPAVGRISEEKYAELVKGAVMFLEGRNSGLIKSLKTDMDKAAAEFKFEEAAGIRDKIRAIESMLERQIAVTHSHTDQDVFSIADNSSGVCVQALFIRDGRLINSVSHHFKQTGLPAEELMSSFLTQFYRGDKYAPDEVIIPFHLEDETFLTQWLIEKAGRKVSIIIPSRGARTRLLRMAFTNAKEALMKRQAPSDEKNNQALEGLKKRLHLRKTPRVIEAFDISNIGSSHFVGAMVSFKDGAPDKANYRLFKIKNSEGPDDYAMMKEVIERRYKNADMPLPDITLIDGGKGQLNIALSVARELGLADKLNIIALAKEKPGFNNRPPAGERIFLPNVKDPITIREGSLPDQLLQRVRDEVHRFAVSYARKTKSKADFSSVLDHIAGIGGKKKKALYKKFGSLEGILSAKEEELTNVAGITKELAKAIKQTGNKNPA